VVTSITLGAKPQIVYDHFFSEAMELATKTAVDSYKESKTLLNLDNMKPFEIRFVGGMNHICIPRNITEYVGSNYMFLLLVQAIHRSGTYVVEHKEVPCAYKLTEDHKVFLHGFGFHLVKGDFQNCPADARGAFRRGLMCATKYIVGHIKDMDPRWFKFAGSKSVVEEMYGTTWATSHETEKRLLDFIIATMLQIPVNGNVLSYLLSWEEIKKTTGLKVNRHKNKMLTREEQEFLSKDFEDYIAYVNDFQMPKFNDFTEIVKLQQAVKLKQRVGRKYRELCDSIIDSRLKVLYSAKGKKKNVAKVPVEELVMRKKGSTEYVNAFNPCRAAQVVPAFHIGGIPSEEKELTSVKDALHKWSIEMNKQTLHKERVSFVVAWFQQELGL
jgi:hypothetical protein